MELVTRVQILDEAACISLRTISLETNEEKQPKNIYDLKFLASLCMAQNRNFVYNGLVSLFNGISTFVCYLMPKPFL